MTAIFDELRVQARAAVEQVAALLPKTFPAKVADSMGNGVKARLRKLEDAYAKS